MATINLQTATIFSRLVTKKRNGASAYGWLISCETVSCLVKGTKQKTKPMEAQLSMELCQDSSKYY